MVAHDVLSTGNSTQLSAHVLSRGHARGSRASAASLRSGDIVRDGAWCPRITRLSVTVYRTWHTLVAAVPHTRLRSVIRRRRDRLLPGRPIDGGALCWLTSTPLSTRDILQRQRRRQMQVGHE